MGNSSVNAKYFQSASIPGAYFILEEANFVSTLPIYTSIPTFSDVYPKNLNSQAPIGNSIKVDLVGNTNFLILPGYKLEVFAINTDMILQVENLSNNAVSYSTITNKSTSCKLYFYSNSTWNILNT